ncbi:MAG TPA: ATP-dependent helicase [Thermodesulfobacteriota bacterium]|nr:ATP-dependent helicase [Thermodesulfobacteriota bacterium]
MPLSPQQIQAAENLQHTAAHDTSNQIRLIAGPGTGKSFAIEERVYWLLRNQVRPSRIFAVSFTRASARDLKNRIEGYCTARGIQTASSVSVTTLHSLALRILHAAGLLTYPSDPMVMDRWELKEIFDAEFSHTSGIRPLRCEEIRREHEAFWSTGQWGPPNYIPPNPPINQNERNIFSQFHTPRTQTYSCVLPGEIVRQCVSNIASGVLDPVNQLSIQYLIVDEFQDLNPCDLEFVDHLIQRGVVTFVAGDDDQSIYSFRFASPEGLQRFTTQYAAAGDYRISDCFRCTPSVVQAASSVIGGHPLPNRIPKTLNSLYSNAAPPVQGLVERWNFPSGIAEAQAFADSCRDLIQAGMPPREILILLSNTRVLERDLTAALDALQVPHERPKTASYIESPEGRLALTLLRIACNQNDHVAHRSLLGLLPGVGVRTCNNIADKVVLNNLSFVNLFYYPLPAGVFSGRESNALNNAQSMTAAVTAWQTSDTLSQRDPDIRTILGNHQGPISQQAWSDATSHLPQDITPEELRDYLWADTDEQEAAILESVYQRLGLPIPPHGVLPQGVRIMTMHGAKGLSARVVFIPGLEEEIFPGQWRIPYPGLVLEAARLLYVSVSRARVACILSYARNRIIYGRHRRHTPSRFTRSLGGAFTFRQSGGLSANQINHIVWECSQL